MGIAARHGNCLVTHQFLHSAQINYRDFVLLGHDPEGVPVKLASYRLAADEKAFWRLAAHPRYQEVTPDANGRFSFRPSTVATAYSDWPTTVELSTEPPSNGLMEKRHGTLIDIDRLRLETRMRGVFRQGSRLPELRSPGSWVGGHPGEV